MLSTFDIKHVSTLIILASSSNLTMQEHSDKINDILSYVLNFQRYLANNPSVAHLFRSKLTEMQNEMTYYICNSNVSLDMDK